MMTQDIIVLILIIWIFMWGISCFSNFFGIKFQYKMKKYKSKVNPIYKLEKADFGNYYIISKYELGWGVKENGVWHHMLIPLLYFIWDYKYIKHDWGFGEFTKDQILDPNFNIDIKSFWENEYDILKDKMDSDDWNYGLFSRKLSIYNEEFNENYE